MPTPHVFWLVQCEVDLVDLSSGYGVRGDEEADACDGVGGGCWSLLGLQSHQMPHSASPALSLPPRTDWCQPGLGTEVPLGLPGWPVGTKLRELMWAMHA